MNLIIAGFVFAIASAIILWALAAYNEQCMRRTMTLGFAFVVIMMFAMLAAGIGMAVVGTASLLR